MSQQHHDEDAPREEPPYEFEDFALFDFESDQESEPGLSESSREFRPAVCPHCSMLPASEESKGYLCRLCEARVSADTKEKYRGYAAGKCAGRSGNGRLYRGLLSRDERSLQKWLCRACAAGSDAFLRNLTDDQILTEVRQIIAGRTHEGFLAYMKEEAIRNGRCPNLFCNRLMDHWDCSIEGYTMNVARFVYCRTCRDLIRHILPRDVNEVTRDPVDSTEPPPAPAPSLAILVPSTLARTPLPFSPSEEESESPGPPRDKKETIASVAEVEEDSEPEIRSLTD